MTNPPPSGPFSTGATPSGPSAPDPGRPGPSGPSGPSDPRPSAPGLSAPGGAWEPPAPAWSPPAPEPRPAPAPTAPIPVTSAPAHADGGSGGGGRRALGIAGRALVVLVVVAALAAAVGWGLTNRSSAEEWQERSEATDADLERSLARLEETNAELDDARERLRALAAEKAGETDENRILSDVVAQAPIVTDSMRDCQEATTALLNDVLVDLGNPEPDVAAIQVRIDEVNGICEDALSEAAALEAAIDELGI